MKYIVAVKYLDNEDLNYKSELFEFNSKKNRNEFIKDIRHISKDIALSQIVGESERTHCKIDGCNNPISDPEDGWLICDKHLKERSESENILY